MECGDRLEDERRLGRAATDIPMTPELQTLLTVSIPSIAVLIGILANNARLGDMNSRLKDMNARLAEMRVHFDTRIDALRDTFRAQLRGLEEVFDSRLTQLEKRA